MKPAIEHRKCSLDGCNKLAKRGPICSMHSARKQRHGDYQLHKKDQKERTIQDVLDMYVPEREAGNCWLWRGYRDPKGYGRFTWKGHPSFAHRVIFMELRGVRLTPKQLLCHHCDNPPCVNPAHLFVGTDADNFRDMREKGRSNRGEAKWSAKLTEAQVIEARWRYANTEVTSAALAKEYGLTPTPMSQLLRGITWKHLPHPEIGAVIEP